MNFERTLLPLPPLLRPFNDDEKRSGAEKQEEENGEEEESDEEEGDEDEIEESDGAAEVTASSADDAAEPERKADISERLKRKHPGSAGVSGREE